MSNTITTDTAAVRAFSLRNESAVSPVADYPRLRGCTSVDMGLGNGMTTNHNYIASTGMSVVDVAPAHLNGTAGIAFAARKQAAPPRGVPR